MYGISIGGPCQRHKADATERVPPRKIRWGAPVPRGRGRIRRPDGGPRSLVAANPRQAHAMEGHALSWPLEKASADSKRSGSGPPLTDATERVPPRKIRWGAPVPRGRGRIRRPDGGPRSLVAANPRQAHAMEGHALSWPLEKASADSKRSGSGPPLTDATERVPPRGKRGPCRGQALFDTGARSSYALNAGAQSRAPKAAGHGP